MGAPACGVQSERGFHYANKNQLMDSLTACPHFIHFNSFLINGIQLPIDPITAIHFSSVGSNKQITAVKLFFLLKLKLKLI